MTLCDKENNSKHALLLCIYEINASFRFKFVDEYLICKKL
jgi:hypothetical protein